MDYQKLLIYHTYCWVLLFATRWVSADFCMYSLILWCRGLVGVYGPGEGLLNSCSPQGTHDLYTSNKYILNTKANHCKFSLQAIGVNQSFKPLLRKATENHSIPVSQPNVLNQCYLPKRAKITFHHPNQTWSRNWRWNVEDVTKQASVSIWVLFTSQSNHWVIKNMYISNMQVSTTTPKIIFGSKKYLGPYGILTNEWCCHNAQTKELFS